MTSRAREMFLGALLVAATLLGASCTAMPTEQSSAGDGRSAATTSAVQADDDGKASLVDNKLTHLRLTRNGSYSAELLFQPDDLTYVVTLLHNKASWRLIRTDSEKDAEAIYQSFAAQTQKLAAVEIDTMRLEAGKKYADHMMALNEQRLHNLQQDLAQQQQQSQQVAALQQQGRQQAVSLSSDLRATSDQLQQVQQNIRKLEAQQTNPQLLLPAPASSATTSLPAQPPASGSSTP